MGFRRYVLEALLFVYSFMLILYLNQNNDYHHPKIAQIAQWLRVHLLCVHNVRDGWMPENVRTDGRTGDRQWLVTVADHGHAVLR